MRNNCGNRTTLVKTLAAPTGTTWPSLSTKPKSSVSRSWKPLDRKKNGKLK